MNVKDALYDAIKLFSDGDEDVYNCLKKDVYILTHTDNPAKFRSTVALILFFTNHNKNILEALNNYIYEKDIDGIISV
jgi:hypothetical protein